MVYSDVYAWELAAQAEARRRLFPAERKRVSFRRESGAGDGFQRAVLALQGQLVATDLRPQITRRSACPNMMFATGDADRADEQRKAALAAPVFSLEELRSLV